MSKRLVMITNHKGEVVCNDTTEPEPGSVVLTNGRFGTAWQRLYSTGLWHRVASSPTVPGKSWEYLLTTRNLALAYDAPVRDRQPGRSAADC